MQTEKTGGKTKIKQETEWCNGYKVREVEKNERVSLNSDRAKWEAADLAQSYEEMEQDRERGERVQKGEEVLQVDALTYSLSIRVSGSLHRRWKVAGPTTRFRSNMKEAAWA